MLEQKPHHRRPARRGRRPEGLLVCRRRGAARRPGHARAPARAPVRRPSPYFVDYVRRYLIAKYGDDMVYRGGLQVETTLDPRLQARPRRRWPRPLDGHRAAAGDGAGVGRAAHRLREGPGGRAGLRRVAGQPGPGQLPRATDEAPTDGPVCLAGGGTGRQPGSAFKPFTLARRSRRASAPSRVYSGPRHATRLPSCSGTGCTVQQRRERRLRQHHPARGHRLLGQHRVRPAHRRRRGARRRPRWPTGWASPWSTADGIQPDGEPYGISLTLGAAEVSPARHGRRLRRVRGPGHPVPGHPGRQGHRRQRQGPGGQHQAPGPSGCSTEAVADNVTDALKGVITSGTGTAADIGRPDGTAGKTGTPTRTRRRLVRRLHARPCRPRSGWATATPTPSRSSNIKGVSTVYGGTIPAATWKAFMGEALKGAPGGRLPQARGPRRRRHRRRPPGARRATSPQVDRSRQSSRRPAGRPSSRRPPPSPARRRPRSTTPAVPRPPPPLPPPASPSPTIACTILAVPSGGAGPPLAAAVVVVVRRWRHGRRHRGVAAAALQHPLAGGARSARRRRCRSVPTPPGVVVPGRHPEHLAPLVDQGAALAALVDEDVVLDARRRHDRDHARPRAGPRRRPRKTLSPALAARVLAGPRQRRRGPAGSPAGPGPGPPARSTGWPRLRPPVADDDLRAGDPGGGPHRRRRRSAGSSGRRTSRPRRPTPPPAGPPRRGCSPPHRRRHLRCRGPRPRRISGLVVVGPAGSGQPAGRGRQSSPGRVGRVTGARPCRSSDDV